MTRSTASPPRSSQMSSPAPDWLPHRRPRNTATTKILRRGALESHKHRDWFLTLASDIEARDMVQGRMLAKFYLFLRDFIPKGLTGPFSHIRGRDVMNQLLCHAETTASRHRVTRSAESGFTELEHWMKKYKTWQEALSGAKAEAEKARTSRKKHTDGKAPGLQSPTGMRPPCGVQDPRLMTLLQLYSPF